MNSNNKKESKGNGREGGVEGKEKGRGEEGENRRGRERERVKKGDRKGRLPGIYRLTHSAGRVRYWLVGVD